MSQAQANDTVERFQVRSRFADVEVDPRDVVIVQAGGEVTVNLRAPIVINPERMLGRQVMPNACVYPLHYVVERVE